MLLQILCETGGFAMPGGEQDAHQNPAPAIEQHGAALYQNG
jgi:hypothetical protein